MLLDDYILTQFIGKGTFGEVYLTKKKNSDLLFATKRMSKDFVEDPKYIKYFKNEILILGKIYHKNIVKLEEFKKTSNHYYVIMEYCNGGTLTECLEKYKNLYHRPFTEEIVQHLMRQIVSAVNYLHEQKIIHRDLKLDNILVKFEKEIDKNNVNLLKSEVKIIDFGFAAYKDQTGLFNTAIGSPMNMDPLILKKFNSGNSNKELGYDEKADIWSLGTLCYQMLIGNCAFDAYNMKELVSKVEEGTYKVPTNLSKEVVSFLNAMLQYDPQKRLNAKDLNRHAFLVKNIKDFNKIDTTLIPKKVYGGELKINIKDNKTIWSIFNEEEEKKLSSIPGKLLDLSPTETPLSESQYLEELSQNGGDIDMITSEPFNVDKNIIEKEFKPAKSSPIPEFSFGKGKIKSPPPEISNGNNNPQNLNYIGNGQRPIEEGLYRKQISNPISPNINLQNINFKGGNTNVSNNALGQGPLNVQQSNGNNLITLFRKLDNGQIIKTQITLEQYKQIQQKVGQNGQIGIIGQNGQIIMNGQNNQMGLIGQNGQFGQMRQNGQIGQNGQIKNNQINTNLMNIYQQNQIKPTVSNGINQPHQSSQNQINKVLNNPIKPMPFNNQNQINNVQPQPIMQRNTLNANSQQKRKQSEQLQHPNLMQLYQQTPQKLNYNQINNNQINQLDSIQRTLSNQIQTKNSLINPQRQSPGLNPSQNNPNQILMNQHVQSHQQSIKTRNPQIQQHLTQQNRPITQPLNKQQQLQYAQVQRIPNNGQIPSQTQPQVLQKQILSGQQNKNMQPLMLNNQNQIKMIPPQNQVNVAQRTTLPQTQQMKMIQLPQKINPEYKRLNTEQNSNQIHTPIQFKNRPNSPNNKNQNVKFINNPNGKMMKLTMQNTLNNQPMSKMNPDVRNVTPTKIIQSGKGKASLKIQPHQRMGVSPDINRYNFRKNNVQSATREFVRLNKF